MDTPGFQTGLDGTPRSARFDDVYFSRAGGLDETRHVFLTGNRLAERFAALAPGATFSIAETGFGTGLNFLAAWRLFQQTAPADARLIFVSTEHYPLNSEQIDTSLAAFPELDALRHALVSHYPARFAGFHACEPDARVDLLLLFGDANDTLAELDARVDAWFLDGFAPARNPDLWQAPLFAALARLSRPGATLATFTAARAVRDGLAGAGFEIRKTPGFGRKRDMVRGDFIGRTGPPAPALWPAGEWHWPGPARDREAVVVGAGLAGAQTARELARRGWRVTVLEQADRVAAGASGNAQGAVYARLSHDASPASRLHAQALELAQQRLADLPDSVAHQAYGLLQLNQGDKEARRFAHFRAGHPYPADFLHRLDASEASHRAGVPLDCEALCFPGGGWVSPAELVEHCLTQPGIEVRTGHRLLDLRREGGSWLLEVATPGGVQHIATPQVVLATAWSARDLAPLAHLPLTPIAGQVSRVATRPPLDALRTVLCSDRYLVPAHRGLHSLGATFHLKDDRAQRRPEDDADNLAALRQRLPGLLDEAATAVDGRAGVRCAAPDYLPLVGPVAEPAAFEQHYAQPLRKRRTARLAPPPYYPGLAVNLAHGSKGLATTPLAVRLLAAWLCGEPLPLERSLVRRLDPNRFAIRRMIRGG